MTRLKDSSQLDFVALLSSVGEDILLPDELACPEYEVSSDHLGDKNRIRDTQPSSIFRAQVIGFFKLYLFTLTCRLVIHR